MGWIETLQSLRLLPPPANELVPLWSTIGSFALLTLLVEDLAEKWDSVLKNYEARDLFVFGSFAIYMTIYWGYSLLMHIAEHSVPSMVHFKIQPTTSTPWSEVLKMMPLVLLNQFLIGLPLLKVFSLIYSWRMGGNLGHLNDVARQIPSLGRYAGTIVVHVLCVEVWFYVVHRMFHANRWLYSKIHSLHHSYKAPSCLESVYVHPIEFALQSFAVLWIGPLLTCPPIILLWMWIGMVTFLQVHDHSGYWLPFLPRVLMHDYHHQQVNCCYGVTGLLDGILRTDGKFSSYIDQMENHAKKEERKNQ